MRASPLFPGLQVDDLADTYTAQLDSALRAGWRDPMMAAYDEYDARRRQTPAATNAVLAKSRSDDVAWTEDLDELEQRTL